MGVDIGVALDDQSFARRAEPVVTLEDDGYYWVLHPLFADLASKTGAYIDLHGDASFAGPTLDALGDTIERARRLVEGQAETWEVHIGTQTAPAHRELYAAVNRQTFRQLLGRLGAVVAIAKGLNGRVVCVGD